MTRHRPTFIAAGVLVGLIIGLAAFVAALIAPIFVFARMLGTTGLRAFAILVISTRRPSSAPVACENHSRRIEAPATIRPWRPPPGQ